MSDDADILTPTMEHVEHVDLAALADRARADPALFEQPRIELPFAHVVLPTPLHMNVAAESATNLWTQWNGYTVADIVTSLDDEYRALRHAAAIADISPLVKYRISGREASAYLARLVAGDPASLSVDDVARVVFCEDRGFVVGDGLLFRMGDDEYRLVTEEQNLAWLLDSAVGFAVRVEDVSSTLAAMTLQGPLSARILADTGFDAIETLGPYVARWFEVAGMPVYVSRTGASGDLGYELWIDPEEAPVLWERILEKGTCVGLRVTGFSLREVARIEAGIARAGRDYLGAFAAVDMASASTPFELGLTALVDLDRGHFTGRDALRSAKTVSPRHVLVALSVDWHEPLAFSAIHAAGAIVGIATSSSFSPSLGINLALARVAPEVAVGDTALSVEVEIRQEFTIRRMKVRARIMKDAAFSLSACHLVPAPLDI